MSRGEWPGRRLHQQGLKDEKETILTRSFTIPTTTVWPEILAGRYFGGLLKICHLAEFTLAVESVLAI